MPAIEILYEDANLLAVHKPAGLLVHRTGLAADADTDLVTLLREQTGRELQPCHRLDRPTSGVILFALNPDALKAVNAAFANGEVRKAYLALVRGWVTESGRLDYALKLEDPRSKGGVRPLQDAVTDYEPLQWFEHPEPSGPHPTTRLTLCALSPRTGRRHQLRRHMAHLRHPVAGDTTHGDGKLNQWARARFSMQRLFLHAQRLRLVHPRTGSERVIEAPVDSEWQEAFAGLQHSRVRDLPSGG